MLLQQCRVVSPSHACRGRALLPDASSRWQNAHGVLVLLCLRENTIFIFFRFVNYKIVKQIAGLICFIYHVHFLSLPIAFLLGCSSFPVNI